VYASVCRSLTCVSKRVGRFDEAVHQFTVLCVVSRTVREE
jgi:hypothetical protein